MNIPTTPATPYKVVDIKIEDNIPLPSAKARPGSETERFRQALTKMQPGQSFQYGKQHSSKIAAIVSKEFKPKNIHFTIRKITETSYRIWRLGDKPEEQLA